ncbi:amidohydrolase family protein [Mesorhizobium sp. NPDC059054]|uniref:amidohydrolase family protein n=1 Tax=Mesorhizobium sp. NPDC059054 TaxID=3346711 RepID=UPI0036B49930
MTATSKTRDFAEITFYEGADILTLDSRQPLIRNGTIAVAGDRILAVGSSADLAFHGVASRRVDWSGRVVMPGLVDGHSHLFQSLGRTLGDGLSLLPWLEKFMLPLAAHVRPEDAVAIIRLAALNSLLNGTTSIIDNHYAPVDAETVVALATEMAATGVRGVVARGIFGPMVEGGRRMNCDPRLFRYSSQEEIEIMRDCLAAHPTGGLVEIWPMPENIVYLDPELIVACSDLARKHDIGWQAHCSESRFEVEIFESIHGMRPAIWMEREGVLSDRASFAHGIWYDDAEVEVLGQARANVVHNPICNQYLASGIIRLGPLLEAGANVTLGSDGTAVGGLSIFEAMKAGLLLQRIRELDPLATSAELMLELATRRGGRLLRRDIGQLRAGALADFVALDMTGLAHQPATRLATSVVMAGLPPVRDVVVNGDLVVREGRSTKVDQEKVLADALQATASLIDRAGLSTLAKDWVVPRYSVG